MLNRSFKLFIMSILCIGLSACLGMGSLSYKQVKMLKQQGFVLTEEGWSLGLPERLLFDFDQAEISQKNREQIQHLAALLQKYNLKKVRIVGHTDLIGNPDYNFKLSESRARSVSTIFIEEGFNPAHIQTIGRGSTQPINTANTDAAHAENRRVAVIIVP